MSINKREHGLRRKWSADRIEFENTKFGDKILKVFVLREKQHIRGPHNLNPPKIMEINGLFHGKLSGKEIYNTVQKRGRAISKGDVIHAQQ